MDEQTRMQRAEETAFALLRHTHHAQRANAQDSDREAFDRHTQALVLLFEEISRDHQASAAMISYLCQIALVFASAVADHEQSSVLDELAVVQETITGMRPD